MDTLTITLTKDELEIVDNYIFRKACKLEESGLTDSKCYPLLMSAHFKIHRKLNEPDNPESKFHYYD